MVFSKRKIVLILGDLAICYISLWVAISVRELSIIEGQLFLKFAVPFSTVFFAWMLTLYTLGLYEILALRNRISLLQDLLKAFAVNTLLGIALFYVLSPYHGPTPRSYL